MSRDISPTVLDALEDDVIYPFFAIELLFDGDQVLRLWTGTGTLVYNSIEYYGTGNLLTFDTIEETSEIAAKGATVTLSGVPSEVISLALTEPYQGRKANIYFGTFQRGQILQESSNYILLEGGGKIFLEDTKTDLTQIFSGYMDQMNIDEGSDTSTVTLTIENKLIDLEKPRTARFTSTYQKTLFPNDKGLEFVEDLQTKEIVWGRSVE
jgi:hypothetical protein